MSERRHCKGWLKDTTSFHRLIEILRLHLIFLYNINNYKIFKILLKYSTLIKQNKNTQHLTCFYWRFIIENTQNIPIHSKEIFTNLQMSELQPIEKKNWEENQKTWKPSILRTSTNKRNQKTRKFSLWHVI